MDTQFIYGQLNKAIETAVYTSKDGTIVVDNTNNTLSTNTTKQVSLRKISHDSDLIQKYRLYGYNPKSLQFDLPLGDTIEIDTSALDDGFEKLKNLYIKVQNGTTQDVYGNIVPQYAYAKINVDMDVQGNIILGEIPVVALTDVTTLVDLNGNVISENVATESILDGNLGGNVY